MGSFSYQAAEDYCKKSKMEKYKIKQLGSAENVLTSLDDKKIDLGIFPVVNSTGGAVIESIYAMSRHIFKIKEVVEIPVVHCLLTNRIQKRKV